jgi:hypothetical protein
MGISNIVTASGPANQSGVRSGQGNTFGPKGCEGFEQVSKIIIHRADPPNSIVGCLIPTVWPAKTWRKLIWTWPPCAAPQVHLNF